MKYQTTITNMHRSVGICCCVLNTLNDEFGEQRYFHNINIQFIEIHSWYARNVQMDVVLKWLRKIDAFQRQCNRFCCFCVCSIQFCKWFIARKKKRIVPNLKLCMKHNSLHYLSSLILHFNLSISTGTNPIFPNNSCLLLDAKSVVTALTFVSILYKTTNNRRDDIFICLFFIFVNLFLLFSFETMGVVVRLSLYLSQGTHTHDHLRWKYAFVILCWAWMSDCVSCVWWTSAVLRL